MRQLQQLPLKARSYQLKPGFFILCMASQVVKYLLDLLYLEIGCMWVVLTIP
jgi:hypothetical protein